jgi:hypothetical protein
MALPPEQILAMAMAPAYQSIDEYGRGSIALATNQLQEQQRMAREIGLTNLRDATEDRRLQMAIAARESEGRLDREAATARNTADNAAAMARVEAQAKAYVDRLSEQEMGKRALELQKRGVQQRGDETLRDFVLRGTTEVVNATATALDSFDTQVSDIDKQMTTAQTRERERQSKVAQAGANAVFLKGVQNVTNEKARAAVLSAVAQGLSPDRAMQLAASKVPESASEFLALREAYDNELARVDALPASREFMMEYNRLSELKRTVTGRMNRLLSDDFGPQAEFSRSTRKGGAASVELPVQPAVDDFRPVMGGVREAEANLMLPPMAAAPRVPMEAPSTGPSALDKVLGVFQGASNYNTGRPSWFQKPAPPMALDPSVQFALPPTVTNFPPARPFEMPGALPTFNTNQFMVPPGGAVVPMMPPPAEVLPPPELRSY